MKRRSAPSVADLHRGWLELVDADGPFLAVPALKRVWPQGMPQPAPAAVAVLRDAKPAFERAWELWDRRPMDTATLDAYRQARDTWVDLVVRHLFGWADRYERGTGGHEVWSPDHRVPVHPTGMVTHNGRTGALLLVVDPVASLRDPLDDRWAASPVDRMEELLRASSVQTGVVTDGRWWALVSARDGAMVASGIVDAQTWIEEPQVRNAFLELLQLRRLVGGKPEDRLPALFAESVAAAEEITEALGTQVRRAVELLVQALSEAALGVEPDPLPVRRADVYEAAVTMMMRVVFLLFAEERNLLPQGQLFALGYGVSDELDALDRRAREEGSESLDATRLTWHRLLATSRALYQGATFEDLRLPSYGGSLFDPARFEFLTERTEHGTLAIAVSDRVMLEVLRAVQVAQLRGQPARRISFRDIDVEQIGYIYEGLLGYSCADVDEVTVGLIGTAGQEPELPLAVLEEFAESKPSPAPFADAVLAWVKERQPAAKPPSKSALTKAFRDSELVEDAERALRAVTTDAGLRDRLRPFIGIIRRDLRNRPLVVRPGGVIVVETHSRASAGAHYTPRSLAEEVVRHALEPLVYEPGPHQQADGWKLVHSERILDLKVADIACGSGAFLVGAAHYLAARLVEAWQAEGVAEGTPHDLYSRAIRTVVATCLYGADINAMAVEMCKLSLWLVSLDPKLPFSFVDDKILHGNTLLGLIDARQLKLKHIDPDAASKQFTLYEPDVDDVLKRAARLRTQLATVVDNNDPQRSATTKRRQWQQYQDDVAQLTEVADAIVAAGLRLGGKPGKALREAYENLRLALELAYADRGESDRTMLDALLTAGLTPTVDTDYARWKPLHWILQVPDVMERGGFDAIIGNPPFWGGQKLTGSMGTNVRDWFVNVLAGGTKGSCDLVGYFFLRARSLLTSQGSLGLIATNSVAQGATREVGLDRMVADGFTITRAVQSKTWPVATANLEYAAVWGSLAEIPASVPRIADGVPVQRISTLLEAAGRVDGTPVRLAENAGIAFQGCIVLGMGFVLEPAEAAAWIEEDPRNKEVLFPYLNGEDLNSRPDASPSRWVIDFNDRDEASARTYFLPYSRILELVKPERLKSKIASRRDRWWQFAGRAPRMRSATAPLNQIIAIAQTSATQIPLLIPNSQVPDQKLVVFSSFDYGLLAVLSSSIHRTWAVRWGSTRTADPVYTPSTAFETFPRMTLTARLREIGRTMDGERREIMERRGLGLTKLYNVVNDPATPDAVDADVARLRAIHVELDHAVMDAYGWSDVPLDHGFHTYRQMQRWTVSPDARVEILDRLLAENLRRASLQTDVPPPVDSDDTGDDE